MVLGLKALWFLVTPRMVSLLDARSKLSLVDKLQMECFGNWHTEAFSKPMPASEAGPSPSGQRRYLWTDAFGIVNFISQAKLLRSLDQGMEAEQQVQDYLTAASQLITAVYDCLGSPRSSKYPMAAADDGGYKGLRIGKVLARRATDQGMQYDGMYWHYLAQFLFAVTRYVQESHDQCQLDRVIRLVKQVHPAFLVPGRGYRWKINTDLTPIADAHPTQPTHDAVTAWIMYSLLNRLSGAQQGQLDQEMVDLLPIVRQYYQQDIQQLLSDAMDPLGLGLQLWSCQWVQGARPQQFREQLLGIARPLMQRHCAISQDRDLNFRLYGALMGMRLYDHSNRPYAEAETMRFLEVELSREVGDSAHSMINKVMFASAVNPTAFMKSEVDGMLEL